MTGDRKPDDAQALRLPVLPRVDELTNPLAQFQDDQIDPCLVPAYEFATMPPEILESYLYIVNYNAETDGLSPSYRDIMAHGNLSSLGVAETHVRVLMRLGLITKTINIPRSLRVVGATWEPPAICPRCGQHPVLPDRRNSKKAKKIKRLMKV